MSLIDKAYNFASEYGYSSFEEMMENSVLIFSQYEERWYISPVGKGFLAWVDPFTEQPLGHFPTFEEAEKYVDRMVRALSVLSLRLYGF